MSDARLPRSPGDPDAAEATSSQTRLSDFLDGRGRTVESPGGTGYSHFVRSMKFVLPATAAVLVTLVVAWPQVDWEGRNADPADWKIKPEDAENLSMSDPRFVGTDSQNRPFMVTAESARQIALKSDRVALQKPKGDITLSDGAWLAVTAAEGTFDRGTYRLDLTGGVELFHDQGYVLTSQSAHVDLKAGTAEGDNPVEGHGPGGALSGEGFRIVDKGGTVFLTGKSSLRILPDALKSE